MDVVKQGIPVLSVLLLPGMSEEDKIYKNWSS